MSRKVGPTTVELEMANRLYVADIQIAEQTLSRVQGDLLRLQRVVNEAFDRVNDIKAGGLEPYLAKVRNA